MNKISVLIPDGESSFAFHVLTCLSKIEDIEIHILSKEKTTLTRYSRKPTSFHLLPSDKTLLQGVKQICEKIKIDLCMPVDMKGIYYFAQHREQVEEFTKLFLIQSAKELRMIWDKKQFADTLQDKKFPHPQSITSQKQFEEEIQNFSFPVLVKPRLSGNGDGIVKFLDLEHLTLDVKQTQNFFEEFIIQEYIEGEDIDCSVLCKDGKILVYTIQKSLFANPKTYQPAEAIEFVHHPKVFETATKLMALLNWNGVGHIDMRIRKSDGLVQIIEMNPRFWGSIEGSLHVGVNFPYLACLASLNEEFPKPEFRESKYMSAFAAVKRILRGKFAVNFFRETNWFSYLKDPIPVLARLVKLTD